MESTQQNKPTGKKRWKTPVLIAVVVILAAALGYMAWQNQKLRSPDFQSQKQEEANQRTIESVAKIFLVPTDAEPTIASIVDVEKLRAANPDFYQHAQNGDRLLIYPTRAIIYRESESKVINVAPVNISENDSGLSSDKDSQGESDTKANEPAKPATE